MDRAAASKHRTVSMALNISSSSKTVVNNSSIVKNNRHVEHRGINNLLRRA